MSVDRAWMVLYSIYVRGEPAAQVFDEIVARAGAAPAEWAPPRPIQLVRAPGITIADLADFAAPTYPERLDAWCRAALEAWGVPVP